MVQKRGSSRERLEAFNWGLGCSVGVEGGGFFRWPTFYGNTNTSGSSSWGSQGSKGPSAPSFPYNHQARAVRGRGGGGLPLPALHRNHRHRATGKLCSIMAREGETWRGREKGYLSPASFVNVTTYLARPFPNHRLPTFNRAH